MPRDITVNGRIDAGQSDLFRKQISSSTVFATALELRTVVALMICSPPVSAVSAPTCQTIIPQRNYLKNSGMHRMQRKMQLEFQCFENTLNFIGVCGNTKY